MISNETAPTQFGDAMPTACPLQRPASDDTATLLGRAKTEGWVWKGVEEGWTLDDRKLEIDNAAW